MVKPDIHLRAIIFDLDNTLVDFMRLKERAIASAAEAMIDAGLEVKKEDIISKIWTIYNSQGYEYQKVFDIFLENALGRIDHKILANGIVAYRQTREASLVTYPHVLSTL
ncbi:MAG TPA: hypothetical protein PLG25_16490, partial [bacterium]|nr:hypothetical protein [bacterium]